MARMLSDKIHKYALYVAAIVVLAPQVLFLYWTLWPYKPLKIHYIKPIEIVNGERFVYEMQYEKFLPLPSVVNMQFVDGVVVSLPPTTSNMPVGKATKQQVVDMPKLRKDTVYFKLYATYKVNPLREITVKHRTEPFEIR